LEKPKHNRFDNIWEIRQTGYPSERQIEEVLKKKAWFKRTYKIGKAKMFDSVHHFIYTVARKSKIHLPIWKIVIPRLGRGQSRVGAIYYIVRTEKEALIFRGTYGYFGTGPHESALIEAAFEKLGFPFEVRDGDYLLSFLY